MSQTFVVEIAGGKDEIKEGESFNINFSVPESYWSDRNSPNRIDYFLLRSARSGQDGYISLNHDIENFYSHYSTISINNTSINRGILHGTTINFVPKTNDSYEEPEVLEVDLHLHQPYGGGYSEVLARDSIVVKDYNEIKPPDFGFSSIKDQYPYGYFSDSIKALAGEI